MRSSSPRSRSRTSTPRRVWRAAARTLRDRADDLAGAKARMAGCWGEGAAEEAAQAKLAAFMARMGGANAALMTLDQMLCDHADGIRHAQAMLADAEARAQAHSITIGPNGSVTGPPVVPGQDTSAISAAVTGVGLEIAAAV